MTWSGPTALDDHAVGQEADLVGDLGREAHLVGRDHHGHAVLAQVADDGEHLVDEHGVERRGDLVEQHEPRRDGERAHDRDALLLAAGEPVGDTARLVGEREPVEQLESRRLGLGPRDLVHASHRQGDVVEHRHVREEVERLEHDADALPDLVGVVPRVGEVDAVEEHEPVVDALQLVDAAQQGRLARAATRR